MANIKADMPMSMQHFSTKFTAPQLLGAVWNWFLYGVLVVQFYVYIYNFPKTVGTSSYWAREFLNSSHASPDKNSEVGADLYHWFAADYIEEKFITPFASFFDLQILGSVVSLSVQFFFRASHTGT
ncbi:hypothetical protein BJV77DRAFT_1071872 [Russula vinacea]|nr:hypothetical protein BJV77DRAFT_1071872 [Russula vinacea]